MTMWTIAMVVRGLFSTCWVHIAGTSTQAQALKFLGSSIIAVDHLACQRHPHLLSKRLFLS